ncbi:DinB family protein [Deinococcus sp.]|uniref:DinB family protein n=1 Tax=Deinococcus sp. TaxID=47478 RepID=UPI003C7CC64F
MYSDVTQFARHWQGVRMVTLEVLDVLSGHLECPVMAGGRTVAETFHHIGAHEFFAARGVFQGRWDAKPGEPDADWDAHRIEVGGHANALQDWLTQVHARTQYGLLNHPEQLQQLTPGNPWFEEMPGWLQLHHAYQDELHHRGQLTVLARSLGLVLPAMYAEENPIYWARNQGL